MPTKTVSFNCSYEKLYAATERIGSFFQMNGHNVDISSTTGSISSHKTFKDGISISIEILSHSGADKQSKLEVIVDTDKTGTRTFITEDLDKANADEVIKIIVLVTRNILDNKIKSDTDLEDLKFEILEQRGELSKMYKNVLLGISAGVLLIGLIYLLFLTR